MNTTVTVQGHRRPDVKRAKIGDIVMLTREGLHSYKGTHEPGSVGEIVRYSRGLSFPWDVQFEEDELRGVYVLDRREFEVL